jgi:hypothetical protein
MIFNENLNFAADLVSLVNLMDFNERGGQRV